MIASLIVMAEFPNFGYMSTFTIWFTSRDKILLVASLREIKTSQFLYQNFFILKRPTVANFVDIVKTPTMFIKNTFKDSKTVKRTRNYEFKCNLYLYFLVYQNLLISMRKHWCQPNSIGVSNDLYFLDLLRVSYNWQVLSLYDEIYYEIYYEICMKYFREEVFLVPPNRKNPRKKEPLPIGLKSYKAFQTTLCRLNSHDYSTAMIKLRSKFQFQILL